MTKESFLKFLNTPTGSFFKVFVALMLGQWMYEYTQGHDIFQFNRELLKRLVGAGVAGTVPILINWLNPYDTRYGRKGATDPEPLKQPI